MQKIIPFDDNRKPFLAALSASNSAMIPLLADPTTSELLVKTAINSVISTTQIDYPITFTYTGDRLDTITRYDSVLAKYFTKTLTYTGNNLTAVSVWVEQ